jgi:hypothetical protein
MDASKIFESVLNCVEESRLNFLLTRTPFSATICLKRSFSKHQSKAVDEKNEVLSDDYIALEGKVKMLEKVLNDVKLERSRVEELYKKKRLK